jgi:hypothetical protein
LPESRELDARDGGKCCEAGGDEPRGVVAQAGRGGGDLGGNRMNFPIRQVAVRLARLADRLTRRNQLVTRVGERCALVRCRLVAALLPLLRRAGWSGMTLGDASPPRP